jgi:hypothetical protein
MIADINNQITAHERAVTILERIKVRVRDVQYAQECIDVYERFRISDNEYTQGKKSYINRIKRVALPMLYEAYQQQIKTISQ